MKSANSPRNPRSPRKKLPTSSRAFSVKRARPLRTWTAVPASLKKDLASATTWGPLFTKFPAWSLKFTSSRRRSAQSTKEIADLIQSIQREARQAVENMDRSTRIVEEGLSLGNDLGTALHKISSVVTEVYKFSQEIGAATNEQSVGSAQIAKATNRLTEITQEINSAVEEQASGAQAVVRAMDKMRELVQQSASSSTELSAAAEQMLKLSRNLLDSMDRFVLEQRSAEHSAPRHHGPEQRRKRDTQREREAEYADVRS